MKFIGHRGYSRLYPENSLAAFEAVINHPLNGKTVAGIELDIHLTFDRRIPVMHETTIPDENGSSIPVFSLSFDRLQQLNTMRGGKAAIPSLEETLSLVSHKTGLCLEIKEGDYDHRLFTSLLAFMLRAYNPSGDITLSSFSFPLLKMVMLEVDDLDIKYGFLFKNWDRFCELEADSIASIHYLHPWYRLVLDNPGRILTANMPLQCWTVNFLEDILALKNGPCGKLIRSVMTDDLSLALKFVEL
jgi:glycerophosphoryl diester phosphodiesterase